MFYLACFIIILNAMHIVHTRKLSNGGRRSERRKSEKASQRGALGCAMVMQRRAWRGMPRRQRCCPLVVASSGEVLRKGLLKEDGHRLPHIVPLTPTEANHPHK